MADRRYPETGIVLPEHAGLRLARYRSLAAEAVDAGFESVWFSDEWGHDPFPVLAGVAERVDCHLGVSVANVFARSPTSLARGSLTLHEATGGKFVLGLGCSTPVVAREFHGVEFERPLRRLRETREILDLALSGEPIEYSGEIFELEGFRLRDADDVDVPVFNAANGPRNVAMSIEHMDGILPHLLPVDGIEAVVSHAEDAVGAPSSLTVLPVVPTIVSADRGRARSVLASYVAELVGTTDVFAGLLSRHGFDDTVERVRTRWQAGDRRAAADAVGVDLMDAVGIVGDPPRARERFQAWLAADVDGIVLSFPYGATPEMVETTVRALP